MDNTQELEFLKEYRQLCEKHGFAVVPTYSGEVSFHDHMLVVKYDSDTKNYVEKRTYV